MIVAIFILKPTQFTIAEYTWGSAGYMMLIAICDLISQLCMSLAYRYEDASRIGPINYFMIVFSFFFQFFADVNFNTIEMIGAIIVVVSILSPIFL